MFLIRHIFFLVIFELFRSEVSSTEHDHNGNLTFTCTHDFDKMFCEFERENCSEYTLNLDVIGVRYPLKQGICKIQQCNPGLCCCSVKRMFVVGEKHSATVWRAGRIVAAEIIHVNFSFKPKTPTITNVTESNGKYEIKWNTNMPHREDVLIADVTYYRKGDSKKVDKRVKPVKTGGLQFFEISAEDLIPDETYLVSVKSVSTWSNLSSESSEEKEFKVLPRSYTYILLIMTLCVCAVAISVGSYYVVIRFKEKWWDKYSDLKLTVTHSVKKKVLSPSDPVRNSVCIPSQDPHVEKDRSEIPSTENGGSGMSGISVSSSLPVYLQVIASDTNVKELKSQLPDIGSVPGSLRKLRLHVDPSYMVANPQSSSESPCLNNPSYLLGKSSELDGFEVLNYESSSDLVKSDVDDIPALTCPLLDHSGLTSPLSVDMHYHSASSESSTVPLMADYALAPPAGTIGIPNHNDLMSNVTTEPVMSELLGGLLALTSFSKNQHSFLQVESDYQPTQKKTQEPSSVLTNNISNESEEQLSVEKLSKLKSSEPVCCQTSSEFQFSSFSFPFQFNSSTDPIMTESGYKQV